MRLLEDCSGGVEATMATIGTRRVMTLVALIGATVLVYATEWLAFLWPLMALLDAGAALAWRRRRQAR